MEVAAPLQVWRGGSTFLPAQILVLPNLSRISMGSAKAEEPSQSLPRALTPFPWQWGGLELALLSPPRSLLRSHHQTRPKEQREPFFPCLFPQHFRKEPGHLCSYPAFGCFWDQRETSKQMGFSLLTFSVANSDFIKHSCNPRLLQMRELTADVAPGPLEIQA